VAANLIGDYFMRHLEPKIYVACLAAYNNGHLHGAWIDANQDTDGLFEEIKKILSASPIPNAEEWAIHDYEDFGDLIINENQSIETVSCLAQFVVEHGELGAAVLAHVGGDIDDAIKVLDECYHGEFNNEEDFAYYWVHEVDCREIPDFLHHYIDYKAMAHDFFINDFFSVELNHKIHVFSYL
jgi:antirestriction protein